MSGKTNLKQVADDVRNFSRTIRSVLALAEALDEIGSIEQTRREAILAADVARKDADVALAEADKAKADLDTARGRIKTAELRAVEVREAAEALALDIVAEAKRDAQQMCTEGTEALAAARAAARAEEERAGRSLQKTEDLTKEVKALEGKVAKLRAQAAKILS